MYYNNNNNRPGTFRFGCSFLGLLIGLMILSFIIRGSLYIFFKYFWMIVLLAIVVWIFRRFIVNNDNGKQSRYKNVDSTKDWHRDFDNRKNTSYHNIDRDFEEVDEEEDDEKDEEL